MKRRSFLFALSSVPFLGPLLTKRAVPSVSASPRIPPKNASLLLSASDLNLQDGIPISVWKDHSRNGNHLVAQRLHAPMVVFDRVLSDAEADEVRKYITRV